MTLIENLLIFFAIIFIYIVLVIYFKSKGTLEKFHISLWGPALMWRTKKGVSFLKRIAKQKKFWNAFGSFGIVFCFIMMFFMIALLVWQTWSILGWTPEQIQELPGPEIALVIPGINPILPLEFIGYIVLGLIIGIVVHEFSHGILTFASKLKVKSLGVLYLIVPIGAFCEPDEEQLKKAKRKPRMRIYAAGPTSNFVVVLISIFIFSALLMSSVQVASDGVSVIYVGEDTPAEIAGLGPGCVITEINSTQIKDIAVFYEVMNETHANQSVSLSYMRGRQRFNGTVMLADKANFVRNVSVRGKGYLGVAPSTIHKGFLTVLQNPFIGFPDGFLLFYILPLWGYFQGYNPIVAPFTDSYIIAGPLGFIPDPLFWVIINAVYWIFWLNLAVALFNVLPMVPLDGGYLFNDAIGSFVSRVKKGVTDEQRDKIVKNITATISLLILLLIVFPWIIKYLY